jgi:hypothetical protein
MNTSAVWYWGRRRTGVFTAVLTLIAFAVLAPATSGAVIPWPGEPWGSSIDLTPLNPTGWASNLSGAYWNPVTRRLWICLNGPAKFWSLREDGLGGFLLEREYNGTGDLEGITQISTAPGRVFLLDESARTIRAYMVSDGADAGTWFLDAIPNWGNSGPEGLAFVPDAWLAANNFVDGSGNPYPQSVHGANGYGGIMFVAVQTSGWVYALDLKTDGTYTFVGRYLTSRMESCEMTFDASIGRMYILHNIDGNLIEITDLTSVAAGSDRRFNTYAEVQVPSGSNIEGFALTPALSAPSTVGDNWCFFTDDSNANGALRRFKQLHSKLDKQAGDGQTAEANSAVAIPPSVLATDPFTNPLPDYSIMFTVVSGGGSVSGGNAATNSNGIASAGSWQLGSIPGANTCTASGMGLNGSPQTFTATATAAADLTPPVADITLADPTPTGLAVVHFNVAFDENVGTSFDAADVTVVGTLGGVALVEGADSTFTVTVTLLDPDAEGTVGISIGTEVMDLAGNAYGGGFSPLYTIVNWPGFTAEPQDARRYVGDDHTFAVAIGAGSQTPSYQWKWDDGTKGVQNGPQTPSWLLSPVTIGARGEYWCEVTYGGDAFPTRHATLNVEDHLDITMPPVSGSVLEGGSYTFTVETNGGYAPLTYRWEKDAAEILGATGASYTRSSLLPKDSGTYTVEVFDDNGDYQKASVQLTVMAGLPVAGVTALAGLAAAMALAGAYASRKKGALYRGLEARRK